MSNYKIDAGELTYKVTEDGYFIYLNESPWIHQYEPYIPNKKLTYEENAVAQIEGIVAEEEARKKEQASQTTMQSQIDGIEQTVSTILANQMGA
jgi:hypothetical protein